jgi:hypothetical protein
MNFAPLRPVLLTLGMLVLLALPGAGQSFRLTLKLEGVTFLKALAALEAASGSEFTVEGRSLAQVKEQPGAPRASFAWDHAGLGTACHEIGKKFGYALRQTEDGTVDFTRGARPPDRSPVRTTAGGVTFLVTDVAKKAVSRAEGGSPQGNVTFTGTLTLVARPENGDPDLIYALDEVHVVTDRGPAEVFPEGEVLTAVPGLDEVSLWIPLAKIPAGARSITRLDGKLISFRDVTNGALKIPFPPPETPFQRAAGPVQLLFQRVEITPDKGVRFALEARWPADVDLVSDRYEDTAASRGLVPTLRCRSGQELPWVVDEEDTSDKAEHRMKVWGAVTAFDPADPPVALEWSLTIQSGPDVVVPFQLKNIPLPLAPSDEAAPPAHLAGGMGALLSPVAAGNLPGSGYELAVGTSRRGAGGAWGPVRWRNVDVDSRGMAYLEGLAPGGYRISRVLLERGPDGSLRRVGGRWENGTVVTEVEAGKTASLPPLRPAPGERSRPATGTRG